MNRGPQRIGCLTEKPAQFLYRLGASERIVGASSYTDGPPEASRGKTFDYQAVLA